VQWTSGQLSKPIFYRLRWLRFTPLLLLLALLPDIRFFSHQHFDTIFAGLDTAGDFFSHAAKPDEKIWVVGHAQSYGFCFIADRQCAPLPLTADKLATLHLNWIFVYRPQPVLDSSEQFEYLNQNFKLMVVGHLSGPGIENSTPAFFIYGSKDKIIDDLKNDQKTYRYSRPEGDVTVELEFL
jgi:hypothetical protein